MITRYVTIILLVLLGNIIFAQKSLSFSHFSANKFLNKLQSKNSRYLKKEEKFTKRLFKKTARIEKRIIKKSHFDSVLTNNQIAEIQCRFEKKYAQLEISSDEVPENIITDTITPKTEISFSKQLGQGFASNNSKLLSSFKSKAPDINKKDSINNTSAPLSSKMSNEVKNRKQKIKKESKSIFLSFSSRNPLKKVSKKKKLKAASDSTSIATNSSDTVLFSNHLPNLPSNNDIVKVSDKLNKAQSTIKNMPTNIESGIKDYLKNQITSSAFLLSGKLKNSSKLKKKNEKALKKTNLITKKLSEVKIAQSEIKNRQKFLKEYCKDKPSYSKYVKQLDKTNFYFNQKLKAHQVEFSTPKMGIENKIAGKLKYNLDFQQFSSKMDFNKLPINNPINPTLLDLNGFQTKAQVQSQLPQNSPNISDASLQILTTNYQNSLVQFSKTKLKYPDVSSFKEKPTFHVNPYKGLPLKQRIEKGFNFQFQTKNEYVPTGVSIGGFIGYKLFKRCTPLLGAGFKTGISNNVYDVKFSNQGFNLRGGFESMLLYGFGIQCLYEENWMPVKNESIKFNNQPNYASFIVGIIFKNKISKKLKSTYMIGYDFLYKSHKPYSSPLIVRIGFQ